MKNIPLVTLGLACAALLVWLLWPLGDPRLQITLDEQKMAARQAYLDSEARNNPDAPNIVLIVADDLGKMDISLYGGKHLQTPAIDSIGREGIIFQEGTITSPICAPSRAGLLTGRYQQRFGFESHYHERYPKNRLEYLVYKHFIARGDWKVANDMLVPPQEEMLKQGLPPSEITIAEVLKKHGYATGIFGKWHLGYNEQAVPLARGFDYHYGFYEAFSLYQDPDDPNIVNARLDHFSEHHIWNKGRDGNCAIRKNGMIINEDVYLTDRIADETVAWIEQHKEETFFAYVPFLTPHTPLQVPREYYDRFSHEPEHNKRVYYAMIASLDDAVARILHKLDDLQLRENTLVIFLSDNGGATYTGVADNAPLKGGKLTNFEGGVNVPFMMRWSGTLPEGAVHTFPMSSLDIFATLSALVGAQLPNDRPYDGIDLMPYLTDPDLEPTERTLYWRSMGHKAVRKGVHKLITDSATGSTVLFDLENDKVEDVSLTEASPDLVRSLATSLQAWEEELVSPAWPRVMDYYFSIDGRPYVFPL